MSSVVSLIFRLMGRAVVEGAVGAWKATGVPAWLRKRKIRKAKKKVDDNIKSKDEKKTEERIDILTRRNWRE